MGPNMGDGKITVISIYVLSYCKVSINNLVMMQIVFKKQYEYQKVVTYKSFVIKQTALNDAE